ncbi:GyrI-like domain-containing protein [Pedobacter sp. SYSU D00535]|uniref:AraC family transcriptional regulator n=1 Tax=Pedobacter sp. SYSU D00535 TaxID=2810308 RepID=UPI001A9618D1|nr:AraC family transcriptional regulator [Pedobacter sp. SYSU D00535]
MKEQSLIEYQKRVNAAIDFMRLHLDRQVSLEELSEVAQLSKFHFSRVFKTLLGCSPGEYNQRLRLGRARYQLIFPREVFINRIAYDLGFSSTSSFSKSFKKSTQMSPSDWRMMYLNKYSKIGHHQQAEDKYFRSVLPKSSDMEQKNLFNCQVKELRDQHVVYLRNLSIHVHDAAGFETMFETLFTWAKPKELINFPETKALTVYRSMPDEDGRVQADVCLTVPGQTRAEGPIGKTLIPGGKYVVLHKEGTMAECFQAWDYLYKEWLPESGYQPDSRGVFLNHLDTPKTHPRGLFVFEMWVSIQAAVRR